MTDQYTFTRGEFIKMLGGGFALIAAPTLASAAGAEMAAPKPTHAPAPDWYEKSFYLLHLDHHATAQAAVGAGADPAETDRFLALSSPDVIQIHAKGRPGWTTYPSKAGHTPPRIQRDVLAVWRDIARRRGYAWSIYYNLGRDGEIQKRRPEWNRVGPDGQPRDAALCYHSGVAEGYIIPMIDEIMAAYQPDAFWFDGSCFTVRTCYCTKCRERFTRETGLEAPGNSKGQGWDAFKEMHRQIYREHLRQLLDRIHKNDPNCRVAVNWAYSLHMPEEPAQGISHLTGDIANLVDRLSVEAHWYDAMPRPFDLMTTGHYVADKGGAQPKPRPQMEQEMAIVIANGGRFHAWDNPTPESGLVAGRQEFLGRVVAPFLRERQRWCLGGERIPAVGLLFTSTHHYAATCNSEVCFINAANASPTLRGASDALQRAHLDYLLVSRERLLRGECGADFLLAENLAAVKADEVQALRKYVENGGTLLLTGGGALLPGLDELCGLSSANGTAAPGAWQVELAGKALQLNLPRIAAVSGAGGEVETLMEGRDASGRAFPLLTRRRVGNGQALAVMAPVFSGQKGGGTNTYSDALGALRAYLLDLLLPQERRPLVTDAPGTVEIIVRRRADDMVVHLVNRAPGKRQGLKARMHSEGWLIPEIPEAGPCRLTVRVPSKPASVTLQPGNVAAGDWNYRDGAVHLEVPGFAIHQMVVIGPKDEKP